jgi:hypothetical protein
VNDYHQIAQPYRIQKRLALNQCFKAVFSETGDLGSFVYVTFGGEDIYDVMDLVAVFDIRQNRISVFSYEHQAEAASRAENSPVYQTLSQVSTVRIRIIPYPFPSRLSLLERLRQNKRFIYFLDHTGTFRSGDMENVLELLKRGLLQNNDYLLITSCLTPRVVNQPRFMAPQLSSFQLFFRTRSVDNAFRVRNHVDLLISLALARFERVSEAFGARRRLQACLLRKFRYADSRSPMGLWLYRIEQSEQPFAQLRDAEFDLFPHAFVSAPKQVDVPNIFDA